jgi:hypothetical protein
MDDTLKAAADLTARQLEEAIQIVEAEFDADPERRNDGLVAAALIALASNYRQV